MEYIEFEGEKYWEMGEEWCDWKMPDEKEMLSSDSSLRLDANFIKEKDYENAQKSKDDLEELQRNDKLLREKAVRK